MKNIVTIVLALACAVFAWLAYSERSNVAQLKEEIHACEEAAQASSAESFILQQQAEKHRAEAEEHKAAAEMHKAEAEEHKKMVEKLQGK